jgi:hypothetical protein
LFMRLRNLIVTSMTIPPLSISESVGRHGRTFNGNRSEFGSMSNSLHNDCHHRPPDGDH